MAESNGNILISFKDGMIKVTYSGDRQSMFQLNDVDLLRALMSVEGMFAAQTGLSTPEIRSLMDDERSNIDSKPDKGQFEMEDAVVLKEDGTPDSYGGHPPFAPEVK